MLIYIRYSMSITEKVFHYEENEISVIKCRDDTWFKAKQVATLLGYLDPGQLVRQNIDPEDRISLEKLIGKGGGQESPPPPPPLVSNFQGSMLYLNESGLYSLIFGSKLESDKAFKRWVTKDVLPSIRKTGRYDHKYNNTLTFKIENEMDLHVKVVSFLKKRYPHSLFTVTLGENQDTVHKRINSFKKGYLRGSPDMIINNLHKHYTGFCIDFKSPKGNGVLSPDQSMILLQYQNNGFKTLVSNDYDHIIE